ncbi:HNH endonuclease [Rapidithrix thailandica]|uniref:HNH endonuclease n=1 Tax=Rapidithrix thailandica TaxID=413964 RepID=A0AAW9S3I3_9BACT
MEKIIRENTNPKLQPILNNWLVWGDEWKNTTDGWTWKKVLQGNSSFDLKKNLKELLVALTNNHCAFCDYFPVENNAHLKEGLSIEHFFPKKKNGGFEIYAYQWENLFPICQKCNNAKSDNFSYLLLKPDEHHYEFDNYFIVDANGEIRPNPIKDNHSQNRAEETITLYDLNRGVLVEERRKKVEFLESLTTSHNIDTIFRIRPLDNEPYRFYIKRFINIDGILNDFDDLLSELID